MSSRRPWLYAVGGAVVATAAVITAIAAAGWQPARSADDDPDPRRADHRTPRSEPRPTEPTVRADAAERAAAPATPRSSAVYFVGDTPPGPAALPRVPAQHRRRRPARVRRRRVADRRRRRPRLPAPCGRPASPSPRSSSTTRRDHRRLDRRACTTGRPAMTQDEAKLALQQVVYSAQAALGAGPGRRSSSRLDGGPPTRSSGEPPPSRSRTPPALEDPLARLADLARGGRRRSAATRSTVEGVANSFEANVIVELQRSRAPRCVAPGSRSPPRAGWATSCSRSPAPSTSPTCRPASTSFTAMTDDPSGGEEGFGAVHRHAGRSRSSSRRPS